MREVKKLNKSQLEEVNAGRKSILDQNVTNSGSILEDFEKNVGDSFKEQRKEMLKLGISGIRMSIDSRRNNIKS